jgi:hypothetical protein
MKRGLFSSDLKQNLSPDKRFWLMDLDADVFESCLQTTRASFEWSKVKPEYSQISMLMEIDTSEFITKLRASSAEGLKRLIERDKERGLIKSEIDSELVVDMIYTLIWKQFSLVGYDKDKFLKRVNDGIQIIKAGTTRV